VIVGALLAALMGACGDGSTAATFEELSATFDDHGITFRYPEGSRLQFTGIASVEEGQVATGKPQAELFGVLWRSEPLGNERSRYVDVLVAIASEADARLGASGVMTVAGLDLTYRGFHSDHLGGDGIYALTYSEACGLLLEFSFLTSAGVSESAVRERLAEYVETFGCVS
jgi:hypothetical protein